jgi:hypothetical protein
VSKPPAKRSASGFFRKLAVPLCILLAILMFDKLDRAYYIPQQLKKLIDILDVKTTVEDDWWRARVELRHRGFDDVDVSLNLTWLDSDGYDVGKSQSVRAIAPGDTVIVRMSMKAVEGKQAVSHTMDYTVNKIP